MHYEDVQRQLQQPLDQMTILQKPVQMLQLQAGNDDLRMVGEQVCLKPSPLFGLHVSDKDCGMWLQAMRGRKAAEVVGPPGADRT